MSTRRRIARRSIVAVLAVAAVPPSVAAAIPADDHPRLDGRPVSLSIPSDVGRSDAAAQTATVPAAPAAVRPVLDGDTSDFPAVPAAIVLIVAAGGTGFTIARIGAHKRRPGLSH